MNIEELRELCLSFKGTSEEIKWEVNLTFMVADKIFILCSADAVPTRCSVKVDQDTFFELLEDENFIQAPYLAKKQWVQIKDIELVENELLKRLVTNSYNTIKSKLTKKKQREIDELYPIRHFLP